jgi:hypothetical protein
MPERNELSSLKISLMPISGEPMTLPTTDWTAQQEAARQRSIAGGGKPGIARMEQLTGKTGCEILEAMMSGELPYPPMNETKTNRASCTPMPPQPASSSTCRRPEGRLLEARNNRSGARCEATPMWKTR